MAGFKTHITASSMLGVGYAAGGYLLLGMPWPTSVMAGGLCGVAGMLPDLDSGSGRPIRESMTFAAAVVPMLLLDRFEHLGMARETMVLAGALIYLFIRFVLAKALAKYTVHRGMFHSIPAALIAGMLGFMICGCSDMNARLFKGGAVLAGYMSHLLLDELYSIEWYRGRLRLKKSFGTAVKLWSKSMWANVSTYAKLILLAALLFGDLRWFGQLRGHDHHPLHAGETADDASPADVAESHAHDDATGKPITDRVKDTAERVLDRLQR